MTLNYIPAEKLAEDLPIAAATLTEAHGLNQKYIPANADLPRDPKTAVNEDQANLLADVKALWEQAIEAGGVTASSFLNMHVWQVKSSDPHSEGIVIPACPIEHEWHHFVQRTPRFDFGPTTAGSFKVKIIWPIEIMRDFERQHFRWLGSEKPGGGQVVYMGDQIVGSPTRTAVKVAATSFFDRMQALVKRTPTDKSEREALERMIEDERKRQLQPVGIDSDAKILRMIDEQRQLQIDFYHSKYDEGENNWAQKTKTGYGSVTKNHRDIARWLFHRGQIKKLPEWVTAKPPKNYVQQFCPKCGTELSDKGYACSKCGRVDKPFAAFKDAAITKDDPAMKRCSRAELDSLGLTDVLTLEEEMLNMPEAEQKPKGKAKDKEPTKQ